MWEPKRAYDDDIWTEEYLERILLSHARLPLPPFEQHIGSVEVRWEEIEPGSFAVHSNGGTLADEQLAREVVIGQLQAYGMRQAEFMPFPAERTASYDDVEAKAAKYWQGGAVDIKVNTPTAVEGVVDAVSHGGTGVWEPSFNRDDPNSGSITTWKCTCPWDQFAWQRTRQWKYLEGRPCAHVLALYWASMATPVDPEIDPATGQTIAPSGQMGFAGPGFDRTQTPVGAPKTPPAGANGPGPVPGPLSIPGIAPGTAEAAPVPGPGIIPQFQGYPQPPVPTSVPGGKVPTADNPMQWPGGTFSKVAQYPMDLEKWASGRGLDWAWDEIPDVGHKWVWHEPTDTGAVAEADDAGSYVTHDQLNDRSPHGHTHWGVITPDGIVYNEVGQDPPAALEYLRRELPDKDLRFPQTQQEQKKGDSYGWHVAAYEEGPYGFVSGDKINEVANQLQVHEGTKPGRLDMPHRPVMYHPQTKQLYVGQPGSIHQDLRDEFAHRHPPKPDAPSYLRDPYMEYGVVNGNRVSWYGSFPGEDSRGVADYHHATAIANRMGWEPEKGDAPDACPKCGGSGADYDVSGGYYHEAQGACAECHGTGRIRGKDQEWHFGATGETFQNSDMVRINIEEYGIMEGKSEAHGAGQYRVIPKNSIGEVLGQDPTTGWVDVIFPIHDTGPMEPYHTRAWIDPKDLSPMPGVKKPGPFIRRRPER